MENILDKKAQKKSIGWKFLFNFMAGTSVVVPIIFDTFSRKQYQPQKKLRGWFSSRKPQKESKYKNNYIDTFTRNSQTILTYVLV